MLNDKYQRKKITITCWNWQKVYPEKNWFKKIRFETLNSTFYAKHNSEKCFRFLCCSQDYMLQFVGKLKLYTKVVPGTACTYSHQNLFVIICRSSSPTKTIFFQYFVQCNPPASCFFVLIMSHQKVFCPMQYICMKNWKTTQYNLSENVCFLFSACFDFCYYPVTPSM